MDAQQGKWVVYHLHGETSLSMVCGNGRQKKKIWQFTIYSKKKKICRNRPYDNEFNLIIISRCHEELQMVNTFSTWKFPRTLGTIPFFFFCSLTGPIFLLSLALNVCRDTKRSNGGTQIQGGRTLWSISKKSYSA